jgi:hypothetical protein
LETSPSFQSEWKLRLEIFLATCWRIYAAVEKYFHRRRKWGFSYSHLTKLTAETAESYLRYSGSLEKKHLEKAVEKFWQTKNSPSKSEKKTVSIFYLYLAGYADRFSKRKLIENLGSLLENQDAKRVTVRTKFRPNVAYTVPGDYGLYSGLSIQVRSEEVDVIRRVAHFLSELKGSNSLTVERFYVIDSRTDELTNLILSNITELLPLVEATCDEVLANAICDELENLDSAPQLFCQAQELAKLYVIARRPLPKILSSEGWKTLEIQSANWQRFKNVVGAGIGNTPVENHRQNDWSHIPMPAPSIAVLQNVTLTNGDVISSDESLISIDPAANPAFSFVAGHQGVVVGSHARLGAAAVLVPKHAGQFIPEGILLSNRSDANWFHWLIETLPKLLYLDAEAPEDVPVIISNRIPETAKECLGLLTDRTIIEILPGAATPVGTLFVASPVLFHPDPVELHLNPVTNTINTDSLIWLRQRILSKANQALSERSGSQSIYIARSSGSRSAMNSSRVATTLRRFGFVVHDPANMSFLEQVVAFHSAKRIVLIGGASMANLIFCSEGAAVVTLRSKLTVGYKMPEILAEVAGARVAYVSGRPVGNAFRSSYLEKMHSHYTIYLPRLRCLVSHLK